MERITYRTGAKDAEVKDVLVMNRRDATGISQLFRESNPLRLKKIHLAFVILTPPDLF